MQKKKVDYLLLSLHHLFQGDLGWCCQFAIIMHGPGRFWSMLSTLALVAGKGDVIVIDDSPSAPGVRINFYLQ
jgi:hypothetical protein